MIGVDELQHAQSSDERQLWCEVIFVALFDAVNGAKAGSSTSARRMTAEARNWFLDAGPDFCTVCHLAGLDPIVVRERAAKMIAAQSIGVPKFRNMMNHRRKNTATTTRTTTNAR